MPKKRGGAPALKRLRDMLHRALARTASLWPDVELGASWVRDASAILTNVDGAPADVVAGRYQQWIGQLEQGSHDPVLSDALREAALHFIRVTRGYGLDLFHCYRIADLPRTNKALEQAFGSLRYHERRASGCKVASPALVLISDSPDGSFSTLTTKFFL